MATTRGTRGQYHCSFCGKSQDQVRRLIAGPGAVYICDECVDLCREIIDEESAPPAAAKPRLPLAKLPTPADDGLVRRWRSLVRQTLADGAALHAAALARHRNDLMQALAADERDSAAYLRLTHRLGFHRCGRTF